MRNLVLAIVALMILSSTALGQITNYQYPYGGTVSGMRTQVTGPYGSASVGFIRANNTVIRSYNNGIYGTSYYGLYGGSGYVPYGGAFYQPSYFQQQIYAPFVFPNGFYWW